jgi:8-oxo-dGTP diphosphatase
MNLRDIDWTRWVAAERATLLFVRDGGRVLLIRKKRGLGAGKINAPGGRLEPGETPAACAIRELHEEVGVVAGPVRWGGEHRFQFEDGYSLHVDVFTTTEHSGTPVETDEAIPMWFTEDEIPFDEMWEDDRLWIPHLLAGRRFSGRYIFDDDRMVDVELITGESVPDAPAR